MSNPADELKQVFSGITDTMMGLGKAIQENELFEKILIEWLRSKSYNMNGFYVRHYNRNGMLEFKAPTHSVQTGADADTLYLVSKAKLMQWAATNRPELLPASAVTQPARPVIQI